MSRRNLMLFQQLDQSKPLVQQILIEIKRQITCGQLQPGMSVSGTRTLAMQLKVNRKTVVDAYEKLISLGFLTSSRTKGTFVAAHPPISKRRKKVPAPTARPVFTYRPLHGSQPDPLPHSYFGVRFDDGFPDLHLSPADEFTAAYRRHLSNMGRKNEVLKAPVEDGIISEMDRVLRTRGIQAERHHFCLVRGSFQTALYLVLTTLIEGPSDVIMIEDPGHDKIRSVCQNSGATVIPVLVDEEGINVDRIARHCRKQKVKGVVVTPQTQFPKTVTLSPSRRHRLQELSLQYGFAIIELDHEAEFWYDSPIYRMASVGLDSNVIYVSSFSSMLPSLAMINYILGPAAFVRALPPMMKDIDKQGDVILKHTLQELLREGVLSRYARKSCNVYRQRRDHMNALLQHHCKNFATWSSPSGGLAFWLELDKSISVSRLTQELASEGIYLPQAHDYYISGRPRQGIRLGFAAVETKRLEKGIRTIAAKVKRL